MSIMNANLSTEYLHTRILWQPDTLVENAVWKSTGMRGGALTAEQVLGASNARPADTPARKASSSGIAALDAMRASLEKRGSTKAASSG